MMAGFQAEENLTGRAPKKCAKNSGRYQVNIRTVGARKPPMMARFQAEENLTGRAPKKCAKILDVIWGKTVSSSRVNGTAHPEGRSFYCGIFRLYTVPLPDSLFSNHSFISFSSVNCKPLIVTISLFGSPLP